MSKIAETRRAAIMDAALDLFVERGFHGAPTSLIARRAGVGVGTIYRYFASKEELIHCIYDDLHARFHKRFPAPFDTGAPVRERFAVLIGRLLAIFIESPRDFRFMEQYHYSPFVSMDQQELPEEGHHVLWRLLWEGRDTGLFKDAPVPVLLSIALGPIISLAKEHILGRLSVDESTTRLVASACWDALRK